MKFLKVEAIDDCQMISLNRPAVKNAFHPGMIQELTDLFVELNKNKTIRAILLKGEGTAFCAGADLNWMKEMVHFSFAENKKDSEKLWQMFEAIAFCEVPVIGCVHGAVFGGALGLVACCDYVFAEAGTKFCFSEVKLGLSPAVISSFIRRKVSDGFARSLMLSAEVFSAEKAQMCGLVHSLFEGAFEPWQMSQKFSAHGLEALRETKKLLNSLTNLNWSEQKNLTTTVISERRISAEGQARLNDFLSKN